MLNSITSTSPAELAKQKTQNNTQQTKTDYAYAPDWMFGNSNANTVGDNLQVQSEAQVSSSGADTTTESGSILSGKCDDGKDDGKIGIGSAIVSIGKGAWKSIGNTIVGIVTDPKKLLVTAGTIVACTLFPPLAVGLGVAGVVTGVISGGKAIGQAIDLYKNGGSDAEAKAAFEDIGASALQVGVSALGVKAGVKAMKATSGSAMSNVTKSSAKGIKGAIENGKNTVKAFAEDTVTGGRGFTRVNGKLKINLDNAGYKGTQMYTSVKNNIHNEGGVIKGVKASASQAKTKLAEAKTAKAAQKEYSRYKDANAETQAKMDADIKDYKSVSEAQSSLKAAEGRVSELNKQLANAADDAAKQGIQEQLKAARADLKAAKTDLSNAQYKQAFENAKVEAPKLEAAKTQAKAELDAAQKTYDSAVKAGDKAQIQTAKAELAQAKTAYSNARANLNSASSNFILRGTARYSKFAKSAHYTSFGTLTAPIGNELKNTNKISNYDLAQYEAQLKAANNSSGSGYVSGKYTFSHDWMDKI